MTCTTVIKGRPEDDCRKGRVGGQTRENWEVELCQNEE